MIKSMSLDVNEINIEINNGMFEVSSHPWKLNNPIPHSLCVSPLPPNTKN